MYVILEGKACKVGQSFSLETPYAYETGLSLPNSISVCKETIDESIKKNESINKSINQSIYQSINKQDFK